MSRNPLSLDMGWKDVRYNHVKPAPHPRSQSAFAGYGLERSRRNISDVHTNGRNPLSLDMGWKGSSLGLYREEKASQSAFAGYGLERLTGKLRGWTSASRNPLSLDMGWKEVCQQDHNKSPGRNPLSLDMGWKGWSDDGGSCSTQVAIRFRWIWVGKVSCPGTVTIVPTSRNPLSLDMGWKGEMGPVRGH